MLTREVVIAVYRQVLGHDPREDEIAHHTGTLDSLEQMLRVALDSEEYAELQRERSIRTEALAPTHVNTFHPDLAGLALPPGTRSRDGVAIVGHEGWLFLHGGSNDVVGHHTGAVDPGPEWLERWRRVFDYRAEAAAALGVDLGMVLMPEKLALYEQHFPEPLERVGPRPIERLLETDGPLVDTTAAVLEAAAEHDVYLRTDSHPSFYGTAAMATAAMRAIGAEVPEDLADVGLDTYPVAGDLGIRFDPRIVGLYHAPGNLGNARLVEDNREQIEAAGGHIGMRRVYANETAPDPRVLVVFSGSFGFAAPDYPGLCWFYAQVFREVHFHWLPFCWDSEYMRRVGGEAALMMSGERFLARPPRPEVDFAALSEQARRSGKPIGVDQILA
jgi:SGNH hydrolase-like domain, acetyltransferase AlgX